MNSKFLLRGFVPFFVSFFFLGSCLYGQNGNQELIATIRTKDVSAVQRCIAANPGCINTRRAFGETPLHIAARYAPLPIVQCLVQSGADVNAVTHLGENPLHYAIGYSVPNFEFLVNHGADINASAGILGTLANCFALMIVGTRKPNDILLLMQILMQADADFSDGYDSTPAVVKLSQLTNRDEISAHQEVVKQLLQYGVPLANHTFRVLGQKYPEFTTWINEKAALVRAWLVQSAGQQLPRDIEHLLLSFILSPVTEKRNREYEEFVKQFFNKRQKIS